MNQRTGKECNKVDCINYPYYSYWYENLGKYALTACTNCKYAHVSQYKRKEDNNEKKEGVPDDSN